MQRDPVNPTLDARGLEPPEPMVLTLEALAVLAPGSALRLLLEREPHPLYAVLQNQGYTHQTTQPAPGLFEILIWRAQP